MDLTPNVSVETAESKPKAIDLEIKDASLIFNSVWSALESQVGLEKMSFPREIFWLNGAPGSGKGTQTRFIMQLRDLTAPPVVVSDLLKSPEAKRLKDAGLMVGDREVTELVLKTLLNPVYETGAVVDGYPRTKVQVLCLNMLYNKLKEMRRTSLGTPLEKVFPKPIFHIIVLFVDEAESVRRQLMRGNAMLRHNQEVEASGVGSLIEVRPTDLSEETTRNRYRTFKEITYESLKTLREVFHYHYINAHGTIQEVQQRIVEELRYQSSLELEQCTYDRLSCIPVASELTIHARQELVKRLDDYELRHTDVFAQVADLLDRKFIPIIKRHSITGMAYVNSEDPVFENPIALAMVIDIFSERGYTAAVDVRLIDVPQRVDLQTGLIHCRQKKVWRFRVEFSGSKIRRGS